MKKYATTETRGQEEIKIFKIYPHVISCNDALVEFQVSHEFIKKHIAKSDKIYKLSGFVSDDIGKKVSDFLDELVEYTQDRLLIADPDYINDVDIEWICSDIKRSFPGISCEITEIPRIDYTHIPTEPKIDRYVESKIDTIREEIEQNERDEGYER